MLRTIFPTIRRSIVRSERRAARRLRYRHARNLFAFFTTPPQRSVMFFCASERFVTSRHRRSSHDRGHGGVRKSAAQAQRDMRPVEPPRCAVSTRSGALTPSTRCAMRRIYMRDTFRQRQALRHARRALTVVAVCLPHCRCRATSYISYGQVCLARCCPPRCFIEPAHAQILSPCYASWRAILLLLFHSPAPRR